MTEHTTGLTPRITLAMLKGACREQRDIFRKEWPEGVDATIENARRAQELGLNLAWGQHWFTATAWKAYREAIAPAWEARDEARDTAWEAREEAIATAWKAYRDEARDTAWEAYLEATATAWKAYDEARDTAEEAYLEAIATAWVAAYIASVAEREAAQ